MVDRQLAYSVGSNEFSPLLLHHWMREALRSRQLLPPIRYERGLVVAYPRASAGSNAR
jgi:hypothetical protein